MTVAVARQRVRRACMRLSSSPFTRLDNIERDAYRVVVLCGADDLIGVRRDVLDELKLLRRGEQCELLCGAVARGDALGFQCAQDAANTRVGVLDVVHGVL